MVKDCPMRHENGNCLPAGGFCTANKNICEALQNAYQSGEQAGIRQTAEKNRHAKEDSQIHTGYTGIEQDYPVSIRQVINITAETGALETQSRVKKLKPFPPESHENGSWIIVSEGNRIYRKCSNCGYVFRALTDAHFYCGNCGAKNLEE